MVSKPLWSGFQNAGVHDLQPESGIVLRAGSTGSAVTADVILLSADDGGKAPTRPPALRPAVDSGRNVESFSPEKVRFVRFTTEATTNNSEPCIDELELWTTGKDSRNAALGAKSTSSGNYANNPKHKLVHLNDGKYGNDRSWISNKRARDGFSSNYLSPPSSTASSGARPDGTLPRPSSDEIPYRGWPRAWQVVPADQLERPASLQDEKNQAHSPLRLFPHPRKKPNREEKSWLNSKKSRGRIAALSETKQGLRRHLQAAGSDPLMHRGDPLSPKEIVAPEGLDVLNSKLKPTPPQTGRSRTGPTRRLRQVAD